MKTIAPAGSCAGICVRAELTKEIDCGARIKLLIKCIEVTKDLGIVVASTMAMVCPARWRDCC